MIFKTIVPPLGQHKTFFKAQFSSCSFSTQNLSQHSVVMVKLSYLLLHHHLLLLSPEKNTIEYHSLLQLLEEENIAIKTEFCSVYSHKHGDGI